MINKYYNKLRFDVKSLIPTNSFTFLDIGCATGNFRKNINFKCEYWGIEPHTESANIALSALDYVLNGKYEDVYMKLPDKYFDCIICLDSIEHMENTDLFFETIKLKLKPNGVLIGSIPNVRYVSNVFKLLFLKDWKYVDSGVLDRTHLRFFTEKSLLRIFKKFNYDIQDFYGINKYTFEVFPINKIIPKFALVILSTFLGYDSRYLQYAFKIKPSKSEY